MTEPTESLIKDEHRAVIGKKGDPVTVTVEEADARRMRDLLNDNDPRWADGTGIAPPYALSGLQGGRPGASIPSLLPNQILTATEWQFHKPFKIGEELSAFGQVFDIRDRLGGRYGYSILVMTGSEYFDAGGELVASSITTITQFDPAGLKQQ